MTELDDFKVIREALEAHHAYHWRRRGPLPHDDKSCEVDDALSVLERIEGKFEALEDWVAEVADSVFAFCPHAHNARAKLAEIHGKGESA